MLKYIIILLSFVTSFTVLAESECKSAEQFLALNQKSIQDQHEIFKKAYLKALGTSLTEAYPKESTRPKKGAALENFVRDFNKKLGNDIHPLVVLGALNNQITRLNNAIKDNSESACKDNLSSLKNRWENLTKR